MYVLALEASTASAKALVVGPQGQVLSRVSRNYPEGVSDVLTIDALGALNELLACGAQAVREASVEIECVGLSSIWHSLLPLDARGEPLCRALTWANVDCAQYASAQRKSETGQARYRLTGCVPHSMYPHYQWRYLLATQPELCARASRIQSLPGWILERCTGEAANSRMLASGAGWLNLHTREYTDDAPRNLLPGLCEPDEGFALSPEIARALGIRAVRMTAGGGDGGLNQIGSGGMRPGVMTFSVGTSGALRMAAREPVLPAQPSTWCYYLAEGGYIAGAATSGSTNCIDWYRALTGMPDYARLEAEMLAARAEWDDAPFFLPFLFGERSPGFAGERTGGFAALRGAHGRGALYYAVLEGILMNLYQCFDILTGLNGVPTRVDLSGGILSSPAFAQMAADLFSLELSPSRLKDASTLGAAALALKCAGGLRSLADFAPEQDAPIAPDARETARLRARYARYVEYYRALP